MIFNRATCRELSAEAVRVLQEHFGNRVHVKANNGTIGISNYMAKIEFANIAADGVAETQVVRDFCRLAPTWGLTSNHLGAEFTSRGRRFKICGAKPKSYKYPILADRLNHDGIPSGQVFKFQPSYIVSLVSVEVITPFIR